MTIPHVNLVPESDPSIHPCIRPTFLDLVLWPFPFLKANLLLSGGLCSAMGCGYDVNALILWLLPPGSLL